MLVETFIRKQLGLKAHTVTKVEETEEFTATRVKLEQAPKMKSWMPTRPLNGEGSMDREEIDKCTCSIRRGTERSMSER